MSALDQIEDERDRRAARDARMYRAGMEAMRERAAGVCDRLAVRALALGQAESGHARSFGNAAVSLLDQIAALPLAMDGGGL